MVGKGLVSPGSFVCYWEHLASSVTKGLDAWGEHRKVKKPAFAGSQTKDSSGLSHQCFATTALQPPIAVNNELDGRPDSIEMAEFLGWAFPENAENIINIPLP